MEIEKGKEKFNGTQVVRPLKVLRNMGIGATSDGGLLPAIGQQSIQQAQIAAKYNYLRFGITGPMIKASNGDKGSFANGVSYEMEEGLIDCKNDINRQLFWDGTSDLAVVSANATGSTVVTATGRESTEDGNKYLFAGMMIDIVNAAGTVYSAQNVQIVSVSGTTTATLTLNQAVTCSSTDVIVRANSLNNEVQGLITSQDGGTSTIYNIDRSAYTVYQGNLISGAGGQLTLNLMQQAYNEARRRGDGKTDAIFCDYNSERFYNKLLVADKRYMGKVTGDGTFTDKAKSYLEFGGTAIVPDKDCPQRFFFLDSKTFKKYVLCELEWCDESGNMLLFQTSTDAYEARLRLFFNLFPEKPSANSVLNNYISP